VRRAWASALLLSSALTPAAPAHSQPSATVYLEGQAFGDDVLLEVVPWDAPVAHRDALAAALAEMADLERLTDPDGDAERGIGALNRMAGTGARAIDPRLVFLLRRALDFCVWSQRAHGPLGGELYRLWGLRQPAQALPQPAALSQAAASAGCGNLVLDSEPDRATLARGARLELWGFAQGHAVDRAVAVLRERGARSASVTLGTIVRAFGPGPRGKGWPAQANPTSDPEQAERILLRDRALAMASATGEHRIAVAGEVFAPYLDQRSGRPGHEMLAVLTVTELAVDAQALSVSLFVMASREGRFRISSLRPAPAVLWMMGSPNSRPLLSDVGWAALENW
jgi:thiamine biosynthesis lipoprotein